MFIEVGIPFIISFILAFFIGPRMLPLLNKLKFGQFVREDGPESHLKKSGTPTMGGFIFLSAIFLTASFFIWKYPLMLPILFLTAGFGIIGYIDDYLKVVKKQSEGLKAYQKFVLQIVVSIVFLLLIRQYEIFSTEIYIPFLGTDKGVDLGWVYYPFILFVILGTVNGVNFTDGVDGLAASVTSVISLYFMILGMLISVDITVTAGIFLGGLLGFLLLNFHPAKVFMGDTGSLALGGYVAAVAILCRMPIFIVLFGIIYLVEVISVIVQVVYYKKTKKRIFKMAPIHHHFELSGMSETQVVGTFTIITVIFSVISLMGI